MSKLKNIFLLLFITIAAFSLTACVNAGETFEPTVSSPAPSSTTKPDDKVRFIAAGDNLIHGSIFIQAANRSKNGTYDFDYAYSNVEDYFNDFDVKFINQETLVNDAFAPSHYPQFSTPIELGDKVIDMGFNVIGTSNNHSYDKGANGLKSSLEYWNSKKDIINVGFYTGDDNADIKYLTINNIKMAFLAYTYGTNGLSIYDETCPNIIHCDNFDVIQRQVEIAKENSDIVIVSCHWGYEDTNNINDYQRLVAEKLNIMGVDVIIGTHPHVIQSVEWQTNDVNDNKTLICYSLGNFISGQSRGNNMIGGLFQFDIIKNYEESGNSRITIESPYFVPIVTHYDSGYSNIRNYLFKDYTEEMAASHGVRSNDPKFSYDYIENIVETIIPKEFLLYR